MEDAIWPALSADGSRIAYVTFDPSNNGSDLVVAAADGSQPATLVTADQFTAVDAPLFSPDGAQVLFSAVGEGPAGSSRLPRWLEALTGVQAAEAAPLAHNVPSDWWQVPAGGGAVRRLTRVYDTGLYGTFAPDGQHVAYLSASGLYLMNADGSDVLAVTRDAGFGTVNWIP